MNYRMSAYLLGQIILIVAGFLFVPFILTFAYSETGTQLAFGVTIAAMAVVGLPFVIKKPKDTTIHARGGFLTVALAWILLSLFGAMPFAISGHATYIDGLFEIVSGFTTTGATIFVDIEALPYSLLFWRSFSHWIGGMGVLVFVIAVLPKTNTAIVHLAKAEIPGPQFGKLVSKLRFTARILYGIYIVLTLVEVVALLVCRMPVFDSFITAFSTAGTGGFSSLNASIGGYNSLAVEIVTMVFMLLFSINMNVFYLIMIGRVKQAFKNEELWWLFAIVFVAIALVTTSLMIDKVYSSFGEALRYSSYQVIAFVSTTGFGTANFNDWPALAQATLFVCMFIGGMAGSTAGGLKISRVMILAKASGRAIKKSISPRTVVSVKVNKKPMEENVVKNIVVYFALIMIIYFISVILVSIEQNAMDFSTAVTAVATCLNNVGPGLSKVAGGFRDVGVFAKIVFIFDMLIGRLEIYPILLLFYPKAWARS